MTTIFFPTFNAMENIASFLNAGVDGIHKYVHFGMIFDFANCAVVVVIVFFRILAIRRRRCHCRCCGCYRSYYCCLLIVCLAITCKGNFTAC